MKHGRIALAGAAIVVLALVLVGIGTRGEGEVLAGAAPAPVLAVVLTRARMSTLPLRVPATGNVAAWQEASVGTEADGLRLTEVRVNVGSTVKRGQVLALFNSDIVGAELAEASASVAKAEAELLEAEANAARAKDLDGSGAMSAQQVHQYLVAAMRARAQLNAARAIEKRNRLRLEQTRVLAPSDGVITSRSATVGAVVPAGQELFRLIRDGRLEWRAQVAISDMGKLTPGQRVSLAVQGHPPIPGRVRMVAPVIDSQTHNGLLYVDIPPGSGVRAGSFARGHVEVGEGAALTIPESAVLLRDGFHYVMRVGPKSNILMTKVTVGRRIGDRVEIAAGLSASEAVVASGLSFLSEGDTIRVVAAPQGDDTRKHAASAPSGSNDAAPARREP